MTDLEIISEIETFLKHGMVFEYVLKKNPTLYIYRLNSINYRQYWFEYKQDDILFTGDKLLKGIIDSRGDFFYRYISDFKFSGEICYSEGDMEKKIELKINATIRIFKRPGFEIDLTEKSNHIEVWDSNQKIINLLYTEANDKLIGIKMIPYDYGVYTHAWSKLDKTSNNYKKQVHVTSYYYLLELTECYERIKSLLAIILLNEPYANNYTKKKTDLPANYNTASLFEIGDNFTIYDRFFLQYSELTIESLYKYWERVAFYLFQFFKPASNKINDKNLSLFKLVSELNKEITSNTYLQNSHFQWFIDFILKPHSDFEKLQNDRHPLVHYKIDETKGKEIGSIISTVLNDWSKNMTDEIYLKTIENDNRSIKGFLLHQFEQCKIGYDHMIGMISLLPDNK